MSLHKLIDYTCIRKSTKLHSCESVKTKIGPKKFNDSTVDDVDIRLMIKVVEMQCYVIYTELTGLLGIVQTQTVSQHRHLYLLPRLPLVAVGWGENQTTCSCRRQ